MWVINILAFLLAAVWIAGKAKKTLSETLPVVAMGLVMVLYLLAYFRRLSWIDGISAGICLVVAVACLCSRSIRSFFGRTILRTAADPVTWMVLGSIAVVSLLTADRLALWWDDINFWATDVKSIFYFDGFAAKYGNTAPEFGDYPPGVQLFKWWFLHMQPGEFREGLMFSGYYSLNMLLLAPLFSPLQRVWRQKKYWWWLFPAGALCLFLLPGVAETFYLEGTCSDLPMGLAYGLFLWNVLDRRSCGCHRFWMVRACLSLSFVLLCKNTGILWAAFGFLFLILHHLWIHRLGDASDNETRESILTLWPVAATAALTEGSWLASCLLKRRVAKLTGAGLRMAVSGDIPETSYGRELLSAFAEGFTTVPIHRMETVAIDLSMLGFLLLLVLLFLLLWKQRRMDKKETVLTGLFLIFTGMLCFGWTLLAHFTIFAGEMQYLDAGAMAASIERYGSPFTLGAVYVFWCLQVYRESPGKGDAMTAKTREPFRTAMGYIAGMTVVFLCTQYPGAYEAVWGYRESRKEDLAGREAMWKEAEHFLTATEGLWKEKGTRILYLRDANVNHRVKDTYINYEASPLGVVYGSYQTEGMTEEDMERLIRESHAFYLYADPVKGAPDPLFGGMTEAFRYQSVYQITEKAGKLFLSEVDP